MTQATLSQENWARNQQVSLLDLLDRLLEKGVVIDGEILLTVADIDLVYLGLKCVLASVETLEKNSSGNTRPKTCGQTRGLDPSRDLLCEAGEVVERTATLPGTRQPARAETGDVFDPVPSEGKKSLGSAKVKIEPIQTKHEFSETPFFENPRDPQTSTVSPRESKNKINNKINIESEKVEKGLVRLVLTVVELLRKLMERQAIRRMEGGSLRPRKMEELGLAFLRLDEKMQELKKFFGLKDEDLNLSLGPLGNLI